MGAEYACLQYHHTVLFFHEFIQVLNTKLLTGLDCISIFTMKVHIFLIELKDLKLFLRHSAVFPSPIRKLPIHFRLFLPVHVSKYVIQLLYERSSTCYNQKAYLMIRQRSKYGIGELLESSQSSLNLRKYDLTFSQDEQSSFLSTCIKFSQFVIL